MQFGVCGDMERAAVAARASYDFAEGQVGALLKPTEPEEAFQESLPAILESDLPYRVVNCFIPGKMKITGPEVNSAELQTYVRTSMERAGRAGIEIIVFGSGSARRIPEDFDRQAAHDQILSFCKMAAPIAQDHGVTVVVEPLHKKDCNVLTSVDECAQLVNEVSHPSLRLLVDSYHMMLDNDSNDDIVKHGDLLEHVHIATIPERRAPGIEPCDLSDFFDALNRANYTKGVSIEANIQDPEKELPIALSTMRELANG